MAGYTRQSIADIINGSEVTAPPLNAEFNQMAAAFAAASGHSHDGSAGNAPKINLATSVSGYLPAVHGGTGGKNNVATSNPTATDDASEGYAPMSMWENSTTGRVFICVGNTNNAAVWRELVQVTTGNKIIPEATDTVDLGEPSTRFQDLWLSGGLSAFGNGSLGGTLSVTGSTALSSTLAVTGNTTVGGTLDVTGDTTVANLTATGTTTITSGDINSGAMDGTTIGASTPAAGTFTNLTANTSLTAATADINGGTVDNATIGATTPSTGAFTTISTSGQATLASADINGGSIDGATIGATSHTSGKFSTLQSTGNATLATADINGGTIDGTAIGGTVRSSGAFTTVSANNGITGDLTGDVTGNVTGNVTGAITGNVTGDLTGNVTSSGTSTFNNVTIDGTLNMNAGTTATITNLTTPTNANDAATKGYVDTSVADLVDAAPGTLDTLNELAAALNDDPNFSTTITNSIATKLPLAGGTMSGAIAMGDNKVTGVTDPTAAQDAATKAYVDQQDGLQVTKSGDSMSGNLAMGSNNITGLAAPTANDHATNKSYVDGILGSATAAAASASAAATSESNAATSETNAGNSAASAAADLSSVQSLYDQFDDRYLGSKASAPTVDNDGNALLSGALYFNTTTNLMYVYGGSGWVPAGSSVNGTSDRVTYTASAGQTVFAATYDAGYVDVYLNGVKLVDGSDFTATNGTSVVLTTGAAVNDIVDVVAYGTFTLADHYTKTQTDARYVEVAGDTMTGNLTVDGTITADGLTVDGPVVADDLKAISNTPTVQLLSPNSSNGYQLFANVSDSVDGGIRIEDVSESNAIRFNIANNGDISFYDSAGSSQSLFWDASAESLGIGTSSPEAPIHVVKAGDNGQILIGSSTTDATLKNGGIAVPHYTNAEEDLFVISGQSNSSYSNVYIGGGAGAFNAATGVVIYTGSSTTAGAGAERMRIDSSGNVGIGTSSPSSKMHIVGATSAERTLIIEDTFGNDVQIQASVSGGNASMVFKTEDTEAMRIDSSGNLLVGTTDATPYNNNAGTSADQGFVVDGGRIFSATNANSVAILNRTSTNGDILDLRKDGVNMGKIGVYNTFMTTGTGDTGVLFQNIDNCLQPWNVSSNTGRDAAINLGKNTSRFKDLYLSGGVYLGGTGSANKLDDYEEGTFTPLLQDGSGNTASWATSSGGYYTKVGNIVNFFILFSSGTTAIANHPYEKITGLPFTNAGGEKSSNVSVSRNFDLYFSDENFTAGVSGTEINFRELGSGNAVVTLARTGSQQRLTIGGTYRTS